MRTQTLLAGALALLALVGSPRAQTTNGTVNFCNNGSNLVVLLQSNAPAVTVADGIKAGLYWAPVGSSNFVMLGLPVTVGVPLPGIFAGGTRVAGPGTAGGAAGQFQVRAWSGPSTSYEQAVTAGGYASGVSTIITMPTGNPTNAAPLPPASLVAGGFQGFGLGQSPIIVLPPTNQYVGIGHTAVFTVTATGAAPLSYQWQFNGANLADDTRISGSLTPMLTIPNVGTNDAGSYRVIVTNVYGMAVSSNVVLALVQACVIPPASLVSWWRAEGNARDSAGTNDGTLVNGATFAPGKVGQAFSLNGVNQYVSIPDSPSLRPTNLTIEGWFNFAASGGIRSFAGKPCGSGTFDSYQIWHQSGALYAAISTAGGFGPLLIYAWTPASGTWHHVAYTFDGKASTQALYLDGVAVASGTASGPIAYDNHPLEIGADIDNGVLSYFFGGLIDEMSIYNRALTAAEIWDLFNGANNGKCLTSPPIITVPPTNQIVVRGSNAVFSVLASGSPALGYQWQFNGSNTLSASDFSLTIANAQLTNAGSYQVIVTNAYGSATSPVVALTVVLPPQIIVQPTNQMVLATSNAMFNVTAAGTPPLAYQWSFNGTNLTDGPRITGSHTNTLTILNVQGSNVGTYRVTVTNLYGAAVSSNAMLTLVQPCVPPPAGLVGWWRAETNALDSAGTNDGTLLGGAAFAPGMVGQAFSFNGTNSYVAVQDSPSLRLTNELTIEFWVKRRDIQADDFIIEKGGDWSGGKENYGVTISRPATGSILAFESAGSVRGSITITDLNWHHIAVAARNGDVDPTFYVDGVPQLVTYRQGLGRLVLYPSTTPLHIGAQVDPISGWSYYSQAVVDEMSIYNRALTAAEILALFNAANGGKCLTSPPIITVPPTNQIVARGSNAVFNVLAAGSPALGYQWQFNGTNTLPATGSAISIPSAQLTNAGDYQVIVTNAYGSATSPVVTLTLALPPQIISQPTNRAVLVGTNTAFAVTATGTAPLSYQWWFNGTNALAATTATLSIPNPQLTNAGSYSVVVSNNYGQATSDLAYLSVAWPPSFKSIRLRYGTLVMTWNGATGFVYQLQYATNLMQLDWRNVGFAIYALSNTIAGYDPIGSDQQRFYRVAIVP